MHDSLPLLLAWWFRELEFYCRRLPPIPMASASGEKIEGRVSLVMVLFDYLSFKTYNGEYKIRASLAHLVDGCQHMSIL